MALVKCKNCGHLISTKAKKCPKCYTKVKNNYFIKIKKIKKKCIIIAFCIVMLLASIAMLYHYVLSVPSLEKVKDSVVKIKTYDTSGEILSTGSGFCAYKNNYIVTNFHVIEGGYAFEVIGDDNATYDVDKIVVFNQKDDLAIIRIDGKLKPLKVKKNPKPKVKDKVTAIGSPKGQLNTVSEGIISNTDDEDLIRISVPISHGSSGGVLLNKRNEVIGITNAGYDDAQNLNFAIRSNKLSAMYSNYKNGDYDKITSSNYKECTPKITDYNTKQPLRINDMCGFSILNDYSPDSFEVFHKSTDSYEIFNTAMYNKIFDDYNYKKLSVADRVLASQYYTSLLEYEDCDSKNKTGCSIDNIQNWNKDQMIMELDVMPTYALAIFNVKITKYNSNNVFNYVNSLPLGVPEKGILLLLYGGYTPSRLNHEDAKKVVEYINKLSIPINDKKTILSYLGYSFNGTMVTW